MMPHWSNGKRAFAYRVLPPAGDPAEGTLILNNPPSREEVTLAVSRLIGKPMHRVGVPWFGRTLDLFFEDIAMMLAEEPNDPVTDICRKSLLAIDRPAEDAGPVYGTVVMFSDAVWD